jgi:hypothetical protein
MFFQIIVFPTEMLNFSQCPNFSAATSFQKIFVQFAVQTNINTIFAAYRNNGILTSNSFNNEL